MADLTPRYIRTAALRVKHPRGAELPLRGQPTMFTSNSCSLAHCGAGFEIRRVTNSLRRNEDAEENRRDWGERCNRVRASGCSCTDRPGGSCSRRRSRGGRPGVYGCADEEENAPPHEQQQNEE